jgi:hypothetical protein
LFSFFLRGGFCVVVVVAVVVVVVAAAPCDLGPDPALMKPPSDVGAIACGDRLLIRVSPGICTL